MNCPMLRFLPEIVAISDRLKFSSGAGEFLAVARNFCEVCRERTATGECPLGEDFGRTLRHSLPSILEGLETPVVSVPAVPVL